MQESLLGKHQAQSVPHSHSEFDAETSFVVWEHEKEALQSRLSQKRERLFRLPIVFSVLADRRLTSHTAMPIFAVTVGLSP
jgi:hypothetical protein